MEPTIGGRRSVHVAVGRIRELEVRDATATGDGSWTIGGYAAVYGQETTLVEIPQWIRVREIIEPGAFTNVLSRLDTGDGLIHLNHGHDMKTAVASSAVGVPQIGSLELAEDSYGERFFARVDADDPDAHALAVKMKPRGDNGRAIVDQASFAFTIARESVTETWLDDDTLDLFFRVKEIGDQFDVCVCAQGAYPQTSSYLRSLGAASVRVPEGARGRADIDWFTADDAGLRRRIEEMGGELSIAARKRLGGSERTTRQTDLEALRSEARRTVSTLIRRSTSV